MLVAMRGIKKDEEVVVDYAMFVPHYGDEISEKDLICKCGNVNCRGKLGSYKELSEERKKKYAGFISDYLLAGRSKL